MTTENPADATIDEEQGHSEALSSASSTNPPFTSLPTVAALPVDASVLLSEAAEWDEIVVADAVFLIPNEVAHEFSDVPFASASEAPLTSTRGVDGVDGVPSIQLYSNNIISSDAHHHSSGRHLSDRPEYLSVILRNSLDYKSHLTTDEQPQAAQGGTLGVTLRATADGQLVLAHVEPGSPLAASPVAVGDVLLGINSTACHGKSPTAVLAQLYQALTSVETAAYTTLRLRNVGGNSHRVATTVEKPHRDALLGVSFGLNERGSVTILRVQPQEVLASSLLNPGDRLISVNEHDCTTVAPSAIHVGQWVREALHFVTIVTETATTTGAVIAVGESGLSAVGTRQAVETARILGAEDVREQNLSDGRKQAMGALFVVILFVLAMALGLGISRNARDSSDDDDYFSNDYRDGFIFSDAPCEQAQDLSLDGRPARGNLLGAPTDGAPTCNPQSSYMNAPGVWYKLRVALNEGVWISTCNDEFDIFDTVFSVYEGSCGSLSCLAFRDDEPEDGDCGLASNVWIPPRIVERELYVQVNGYGATSGEFGIKVERGIEFEDSTCQCAYPGLAHSTSPSPALSPTFSEPPAYFGDSWVGSGSPVRPTVSPTRFVDSWVGSDNTARPTVAATLFVDTETPTI
jgi:hypothetical protein